MSTRLFFVISLTILLLGCSKDQVKEDEPVEVTDLTADPASSSEDGAQTYGAEDDSGPAFSQLDDPQSPLSVRTCLLYTSPSPRDGLLSRMPSSA